MSHSNVSIYGVPQQFVYLLVFFERHFLTVNIFDREFVDGLGILPPVFWPLTSLPTGPKMHNLQHQNNFKC